MFIIIHGTKTNFFVESRDSDIGKLVGNVVSEKTIKHASAKKRQVFWDTAKVKFIITNCQFLI